jgi:hypothetical protein
MTRPGRSLALALPALLALTGAPAATQSFEDLQQGPIAPCLADHFDPDRYQAELAALGWNPAPASLQDAVVEILAHAFVPVTDAARPDAPDDLEQRLDRARGQWRSELQTRTAFVQGESVLYLRGLVQADAFRRIDCWLVTPDAGFVNGLIAQGEPPVAEGAEVAVALGPFVVSEQAEAMVIASRFPHPPGPVWGLTTQMLIRPAQP